MRPSRTWLKALPASAALTVALAAVAVVGPWGDEAPAPYDPEPLPPGAPVAVVIGDSFTSGSDENQGPEWPELLGQSLGWRVVREAIPGTGYVGARQGPTFGQRVDDALRHRADVYIVAGGFNDKKDPLLQVTAAASDVVARLHREAPAAKVVLVSSFSNGDPRQPILDQTAALREVAESQDVLWVDATRFLPSGEGLIGNDRVHPTDDGHHRLATEMAKALDQVDPTLQEALR